MKNIALIIPSLKRGGAERVVSIWASELSKITENVCLIVMYKSPQEYDLYGNVNKIYLYENYEESKKTSLLKKVSKLRKTLKEHNTDVAVPFISHIGIMTTFACLFTKTAVVETVRNNPGSAGGNSFYRAISKLSIRLAKRLIVQNRDQKDYFSKKIQKKTKIFPNPLHPDVSTAQKEYKREGTVEFISVGRLEKQKNQKLLCSAFALASEKCPSISLKIYGMGSMYDELQQHINILGMQNKIFLCGKTDDVAGVLSKADAFVLSSDFEGMPNALMEAMAVGLPCVSTDCPTGPSDMIEDGKSGFLVPVGEKEKMAEAIVKIAKDYSKSVHMGMKARKAMLERTDAAKSAKKLLDFIGEI